MEFFKPSHHPRPKEMFLLFFSPAWEGENNNNKKQEMARRLRIVVGAPREANEILERNDSHIPYEFVPVGTSSFSFTLFFFPTFFFQDGSVLLKCGLVLFNGVIFLTPSLSSILETKVSGREISKKKGRDRYKKKIFYSTFWTKKNLGARQDALHAYIFLKCEDFFNPDTRVFLSVFHLGRHFSPLYQWNRDFFTNIHI